jgi:hypothetical protein
MGLGFARFYDPQASAQVAVVGQFIGLPATLVFLSRNGHLLLISTLVPSFESVPPAADNTFAGNWMMLAQWGGMIMRAGGNVVAASDWRIADYQRGAGCADTRRVATQRVRRRFPGHSDDRLRLAAARAAPSCALVRAHVLESMLRLATPLQPTR